MRGLQKSNTVLVVNVVFLPSFVRKTTIFINCQYFFVPELDITIWRSWHHNRQSGVGQHWGTWWRRLNLKKKM